MRSMWKGSVSFGLVSIPIQLYAATENKNVSLRQVHEADGGRIQYKRFCTIDGEEVPYAEIAKGYELPDGEMVVLTDEDMSELPLASSRAIDVLEFVPLESIDPIQFDKTYYLEPQKNAVKPYVVLRDALQKASHVAVAKVAIRQRETLAILRVHSDVLTMTTMLWPDEVRVPDFGFLHDDPPQVRPQELTMAGSLIDSLSEPVFEQDKYTDSYREALEAMIEAKAAGNETTKPKAVGAKADVVDLMEALQASVSEAKKSRKPSTAKKATAAKKPASGKRTPKSA
ncbi:MULTISPECIES: non-homologous end joining protein Ku [Amycolatopsis]|uniref:Non-homologous end joining protein Ku n=2 Tax=Amycolatopsis japonica group TaxID=2893673 RepID=R4T7P5_9PSEU|nr:MULTISPECIES: Ku protein [Amycolatopsis]AGM06977.1 DNA end-binding protein Ku [Amycolatopsis keratiniphila]AIG76235.1 Putative DNA repair protein [Amycolatopsis japonica]OKK01260.1 DNA repair protein [Amycolatopsis sp. CB00013]RSN20507.1 Ku protein [Amycolatopsis sp. WAC 04169]RSN41832.1 Ku protein [Amycolatopsis sp. WAC 04197]